MLTKVDKYSIHNNIPYSRGVVIHINENEAIVAKFLGRNERAADSNQLYDTNIVLLTSNENPHLLKHYEHEEMVFVRCQYNGRVDGPDEIEWVEVSPKFEIVREGHVDSKQLQLLDKYLIETPPEEIERLKNEFFGDATETNEHFEEERYFTTEEVVTLLKAFHLDSVEGKYSKELLDWCNNWIDCNIHKN